MRRTKERANHSLQKRTNMICGILIQLVATVLAVYVGGWIMFIQSITGTVVAFQAGTLTMWKVIVAAVKCALSATVAGAIWCVGYIFGNYFREKDEE